MIKEYYRAKSKDDAWKHIKTGAKILGGGNHISRNQEDIDYVVDLQNLKLDHIKEINGFLKLDANVTLQNILENHKTWDSLKKVIDQEYKLNTRNSATISGAAVSGNGRSNLVGWLICSDAKFRMYPSSLIVKSEDLCRINFQEQGFIDQISIPMNTNISWRMVSRSPDDFPLVSIFINKDKNDEIIKIVLIGFGEIPLILQDSFDPISVETELIKLIDTSHSQFTNKFCSLSYFKQTAVLLLNRLLVEE
jgi:CO/xanthine dehydrogenase FAD-binding subunit